jgi:hypothetical protein
MAHAARARRLNDRQWARAAGIRQETLSRLRHRASCDTATLEALAKACGLELVVAAPRRHDAAPLFPQVYDRELEERLLALCTSGSTNIDEWRALAPAFFMAGVAHLLSCTTGFDADRRYASLAEALHPGISSPQAFRLWLKSSAVKPSRFLPLLRKRRALKRTRAGT